MKELFTLHYHRRILFTDFFSQSRIYSPIRKKTLNHPIFIGNSRFFIDLHDKITVQILMRTVRLCVHLRCDIFDLHTSLLCKVLSLTFLPAMRIIQLKSAFSAMRIFQFYITLTISLITFQQSHYVTN